MTYNQFSPMYPYNIPSGTNDIQGVRWVSSIDEVRATTVPFGRQIFMNQDNDIFYIKDTSGNIRCFEYKETDPPVPENFVTRKEFDELRSKYEQLVQQQSANANQPQSVTDHARNAELSGNSGASQGGVLQEGGSYGNGFQPDQQYGSATPGVV